MLDIFFGCLCDILFDLQIGMSSKLHWFMKLKTTLNTTYYTREEVKTYMILCDNDNEI